MSIWYLKPTPQDINDLYEKTAARALGIRFTEVGDDYLKGVMPVDARTHQPMGLLHGGASVLLAESLGSAAGNYCVDPDRYMCVGLEINANHLRGVSEGMVEGVATPVHLGKSTQVWDIRISQEQGKPVCISRLTLAVLSNNK